MRFQDVVKFVHKGNLQTQFRLSQRKIGKKKTTRADALVLRIEGKP